LFAIDTMTNLIPTVVTAKVVGDVSDRSFGRLPRRRLLGKKRLLLASRRAARPTRQSLLTFGNFRNVGF